MDIYVLICKDRHIEIFVRVFSNLDIAIAYAENFIKNNARCPEDIKLQNLSYSMIDDGWVYYATYSPEDCIRIEKRRVITKYP